MPRAVPAAPGFSFVSPRSYRLPRPNNKHEALISYSPGRPGARGVDLARWLHALTLSKGKLQQDGDLTVERATLALGKGNNPSMNVIRNPECQLHVSIHAIAMMITCPRIMPLSWWLNQARRTSDRSACTA
jgi:hypothetical protein